MRTSAAEGPLLRPLEACRRGGRPAARPPRRPRCGGCRRTRRPGLPRPTTSRSAGVPRRVAAAPPRPNRATGLGERPATRRSRRRRRLAASPSASPPSPSSPSSPSPSSPSASSSSASARLVTWAVTTVSSGSTSVVTPAGSVEVGDRDRVADLELGHVDRDVAGDVVGLGLDDQGVAAPGRRRPARGGPARPRPRARSARRSRSRRRRRPPGSRCAGRRGAPGGAACP